MDYLAILNILFLSLISLFHLYWVFGGRIGLDVVIPEKDGKPMFIPGPVLTFLVALLVLVFAFVLYTLQFSERKIEVFNYAGWMISIIFFLRAVGDFNAVGFFKKLKQTIFARYDTRYFSPLCLFLALSSAIITYQA